MATIEVENGYNIVMAYYNPPHNWVVNFIPNKYPKQPRFFYLL